MFFVTDETNHKSTTPLTMSGVTLSQENANFFVEKAECYKKAFGLPFLITEDQELEVATRHHHAVVKVHERERLLMPFWFISVSAVGSFSACVNVKNPRFSGWNKMWYSTPKYDFSYPFEEHHKFNQISASYLHDQQYVEDALCSTTSPSMLLSRFELLEELEKMSSPPKLIPFVMSNTTAYGICKGRVTRSVVLKKMSTELRKLHGRFNMNQISVNSIDVVVEKLRPVFLPMTKMIVTTAFQTTKLPLFICGATGKTSGPVLYEPKRKKTSAAFFPAVGTLLSTAPFYEPHLVLSWSVLAALMSLFVRMNYRTLMVRRELVISNRRLKTTGLLHFSTDQKGYRWTVEDEERQEYEYREELRSRAQSKTEFEERVREETARDDARRNASFNARKRQRNDVIHQDPLGLYDLLGLRGKESSVSQKDIAEAFREVARVNHPDLQTTKASPSEGADDSDPVDESVAHKRMQRILEAYRILRDPKKRKQYDCGLLSAKDLEASA